MKASVNMITYNHGKFIAESIEGVLSQRTNFDFELVIGEDCSPDDTCAVAARYEKKYPDKIRLLRSVSNLGMNRNFARTLAACRGEYIALLDGDDYWTSPHKLQRQVDFLDSNPDFSISYHNATVFEEANRASTRMHVPEGHPPVSTIEDLITAYFLPTCTIMFRSSNVRRFPEWYFDLPYGDWTLMIFMAQYGKLGYIDEPMAARRVHPGGAWSGRNPVVFWQGSLAMYEHLHEYFGGKYDHLMKGPISMYYHLIAADHEMKGDMEQARSYALRRLKTHPFDREGERPLLHLTRLYMPRVYNFARSCRNMALGL